MGTITTARAELQLTGMEPGNGGLADFHGGLLPTMEGDRHLSAIGGPGG